MRWFESRGVPLIVEDDNRVFPKTEKSQSIISCLLDEVKKQGVHIALGQAVKSIEQKDYRLLLTFSKEDQPSTLFDKVIVASGGSPKRGGLKWLEDLNHKIVDPVPSLFTFNMPGESITELMGVVVENVLVNIQGTKLNSNGPLLVTHWGMSGPAILKLSAFGARILNERNYSFKLQVNWTGEKNNEVIFEQLRQITQDHAKKMLSNVTPFSLPQRMWLYLLDKSDLSQQKKWGEIGKKSLNKLTNVLVNDIYQIKGKTTFKEEFVTCGGVSLESVDLKTMQSKVCKNLYFAGEILDIDAITGGYNFQNAWTTGYIAGKLR
jgi:hypothetical protein